MANNLIISYDLHKPVQNYNAVIEAIKSIVSPKIHLQQSVFYVNTLLTADQVATKVFSAMDKDDQLIVVDATNRLIAWRGNVPHQTVEFIRYYWNS